MKSPDDTPNDPHELTIEVLGPGGASVPSSSSSSGPSDTVAAGRSAVPLFSDRRRGVGAVVGGIVLLGLVALLGGILSPPPDRAQTETVTNPLPSTASDLQLAGFGGTIGGSLAGDAAALAAIRLRTLALGQESDLSITSSPQDVLVLWAGDVNGGRHAVVMFRQKDVGWSVGVLSGPGGSPIAQLSLASWMPSDGSASYPTTPVATFVDRSADDSAGIAVPAGAVFVVAPLAHGVEIATARRFFRGGVESTTWCPLRRQGGMVWVGALNPAEEYLASYRTARRPGTDEDTTPTVVNDSGPGIEAEARRIATGSALVEGEGALDCSADEAKTAGASPAEKPVFATTTGFGPESQMAATVLKSPDGGYLWGLCEAHLFQQKDGAIGVNYEGGGVVRDQVSGPGQVMGAVSAALMDVEGNGPESKPRYLVLAPAGADQVRIGRTVTKVHDRLAVVALSQLQAWSNLGQFQGQSQGPVTVEALAHGKVVRSYTIEQPIAY